MSGVMCSAGIARLRSRAPWAAAATAMATTAPLRSKTGAPLLPAEIGALICSIRTSGTARARRRGPNSSSSSTSSAAI